MVYLNLPKLDSKGLSRSLGKLKKGKMYDKHFSIKDNENPFSKKGAAPYKLFPNSS